MLRMQPMMRKHFTPAEVAKPEAAIIKDMTPDDLAWFMRPMAVGGCGGCCIPSPAPSRTAGPARDTPLPPADPFRWRPLRVVRRM